MATNIKRVSDLNGVPRTLKTFMNAVIWGIGDGAPTDLVDGKDGAAKASLYLDRVNGEVYKNTGTKAAPTWNSLGGVAASEITLAEGNVLIGNSSGVGVALDLGNTSAGIAIGDGTTATIHALSGDVTMSTTG